MRNANKSPKIADSDRSHFFHCGFATPFLFFCTKCHGNIPTRTVPNGDIKCRGLKKSRFSTNISLYLDNDTR